MSNIQIVSARPSKNVGTAVLQGIVVAGLEPRVHAGQGFLTPGLKTVYLHAQLAREGLHRLAA